MEFIHTGLASSCEENADRFFIDILGLEKSEPKTLDKNLAQALAIQAEVPFLSLDNTPINPEAFSSISNETAQKFMVVPFAFAEDNSLVGEYSTGFRGGTFTLSEGVVLIEEEIDRAFGLSNIDDQDEFENKFAAISANERKETAVTVLINEGMHKEAEKLVGLMDSEYSRGRKEVMSGYLLAMKGECDKASLMFDKASDINANVCIPDKYWDICEH